MGNFVYSDESGLWMRFSRYNCADKSLPTITLIPTIHAGNKAFYQEAKDEGFCNDIVLYENAYVPFKRFLKWLYQIIALKTKLTLEGGTKNKATNFGSFHQKEPNGPRVREFSYTPPGLPKREMRQVIADADREKFLLSMRKIPLRAKLAFPFILIFLLIAAPFIVSRDLLISLGHKKDCGCKHCRDNTNHKHSSKRQKHKWDVFNWCLDHYDTYIIHDRDEILKNILTQEIYKPQHRSKLIGVRYGAGHMDKLEQSLKDLGYSLTDSRLVLALSKCKKHHLSEEDVGYNVAWTRFKNLPSNITPEKCESILSINDKFYENTQTCYDYKNAG